MTATKSMVTRALNAHRAMQDTTEDAERRTLRQDARMFADLAQAQATRDLAEQHRVANVLAYLSADRSSWHEDDEADVRAMLHLDTEATA